MKPALVSAIGQVIEYFNSRRLDLPDGFFDRRTQFVINGAPFETLLGQSPADPLVLMLARGPAGYRFTSKALQHAVPDVRVERGDVVAGADPLKVAISLWLSGRLRITGEPINVVVPVALTLTPAGHIEAAEATVDEATLDKIRQARLRP